VIPSLLIPLFALCGCKASAPTRIETWAITGIKHHLLVRNKRQTNPLPASAENVQQGRTAFTQYCYVCHGYDGQATGVPFADKMSPPVPSLASPSVQSYSDGQLKSIIENGLRPSGMPGARGILSDDEMWSIVLYIRHLPAKGSMGEPCIYDGECPPVPAAAASR
jgi:mono/diheme cytochrome c family protein